MGSEPMRGLSIQQPWANTIAYGTKRVENRTWAAPRWVIGRTIAIHASKKPDISARPPEGESWPMSNRMHLGAVIALAEVTGCHHSDECMLPASAVPPGVRAGCSLWAARGQWHWSLIGVRSLPEPVPCRGMLGLWRLPDEVEKAVRTQLEDDPNGC
jgi:ASCH domain